MSDTPILKTRRFTVTSSYVRSPNDTYSLDAVSHCRLRRPAMLVVSAAVFGLSGLIAVWWSELFDGERAGLILIALTSLWISSRFARVQLMSLSLREETYLIGRTSEMRAVKSAIEIALTKRQGPAAGRWTTRSGNADTVDM